MSLFNRKHKIKRYAEITWEYPVPPGQPFLYHINSTNNPQDCDRSMGNGGRGYQLYDLHDTEQRQSFMDLYDEKNNCLKGGYYFNGTDVINKALKEAGFKRNKDGSLNPEDFFQFINKK